MDTFKTHLQRGFQATWGLWLALAVLLPVGLGGWAVITLMRLPEPLNCDTSTASDAGAARFYCAQTAAQNGSADSLQRAIQMMSMLPKGHPLRAEGDRLIEEWASQILAIAETEFQQGDLDEAIDIAQKIPGRIPAAQQVNETIDKWETIWADAEDTYEEAKQAIRQRQWQAALAEARELVRVDNQYWASTQYLALLNEIQMEKESSDLAQQQENERNAKRRDRSSTLSTEEVLTQWEQERAAEDATRLDRARSLARSGTVEGFEDAISEARGVVWGTAQYEEAQALIQDWQQQVELMEDQPYLDRAMVLANQGDIESLRAAIREARQIPSYRQLYDQAQAKIEVWEAEVERLTVEQLVPDSASSPDDLYPIQPADSQPRRSDEVPEAPSITELFEEVYPNAPD